MTDQMERRCSEMEANAMAALRRGNAERAADYLLRAIGYTPFDYPATRLTRALALCETDTKKAICVLDGHDHVGGATCYRCGEKRS